MRRDELFESILDDMTADDNVQDATDVLTAEANAGTGLPEPADVCYRYLISVSGGYMVNSVVRDADEMIEYTRQGFLDVLDNCRGIRRYSDVLVNKEGVYPQPDDKFVTFFFSMDTQFRKPADILRFIDSLYVVAQKMRSSKWLPTVQTATWIRCKEYDAAFGSYDDDYLFTFKETELLHRRLKREKNSFVSDDAFKKIHSMVCHLMGRSLTFPEFCNFKMTLDGTYDVPKTVMYMLCGFAYPDQSITLPLIARSEVHDKSVDFRNLVLKWTKFTYVFRIPSCTHGPSKELPVLMPVRGDCEDSALRDEICDAFEKDSRLEMFEPYIFLHNAQRGGGGRKLTFICRTYADGLGYINGFVVSVPVTKDDDNPRRVAAWVLSGILREGLSLDAKRAIERQ